MKKPQPMKKTKQTTIPKLAKKIAQKAKEKKKAKHFRFLDLPPELRDMIYEMALTDANGISIVTKTRDNRSFPGRGRVYPQSAYRSSWRGGNRYLHAGAQEVSPIETKFIPAILAVNKQINAEAINYLYGHNFAFEDTAALFRFLSTIGLRNQQRLVNLEVMRWGVGRQTWKANNYAAMTTLAGATNLKSLALNCDIGSGSLRPRWVAKALFRDAHRFLEAYGSSNSRKDAAVDIIHVGDINFYVPAGQNLEPLVTLFKTELRTLLGATTITKKVRR